MPATIRPMSQLKNLFDNQPFVTIEAGCTVREFLVRMHIEPQLVAGVIVNGELQSKDYAILEGDDIKLFAVVSGG